MQEVKKISMQEGTLLVCRKAGEVKGSPREVEISMREVLIGMKAVPNSVNSADLYTYFLFLVLFEL